MDWFKEEIYETYPIISELDCAEMKCVNIRVMRLETTKVTIKDTIDDPQISFNLFSETSFDKSVLDLSPNRLENFQNISEDLTSHSDPKNMLKRYNRLNFEFYKSEKSPVNKLDKVAKILEGVLKRRKRPGATKHF